MNTTTNASANDIFDNWDTAPVDAQTQAEADRLYRFIDQSDAEDAAAKKRRVDEAMSKETTIEGALNVYFSNYLLT